MSRSTEKERAQQVTRNHRQAVSELLGRHFAGLEQIEILEGGCGSSSHVTFPTGAKVTGIDISAAQLERNSRIQKSIVGDLQTYSYRPESFDAVVCWDVLEHLSDPAAALDRFGVALRPGGLMILGFPNRRSLKGWLTRVLPYITHVWLYRWVLGSRNAGKDDVGPFPTPMRAEMAPDAVTRRMGRAGFEVMFEVSYESTLMVEVRRRFGLVGNRWRGAKRLLYGITRGRLEIDTTDCIVVLHKTTVS